MALDQQELEVNQINKAKALDLIRKTTEIRYEYGP